MFNDDIRALTAKKYEILGELELAKAAILREMSTVDKCALSRLREILDHYDRLEKSVIEKMNTFDTKFATFISSAEKEYAVFGEEIKELEIVKTSLADIEKEIASLNEITKPKPYDYNSVKNSVGAINNMLQIGASYFPHKDKFAYGHFNSALTPACAKVNGKWQIDCSIFVSLVLQGVTFENSRYNGRTENAHLPCFHFTEHEEFLNPENGRPEGMLAGNLANYAKSKGYLYEINGDIDNVEVGDILFTSNSTEGTFEDIGHCSIVVSKSPMECAVRVMEVTEDTFNIGYNVISNDNLYRVAARFPLSEGELVFNNLASNHKNSWPLDVSATIERGSNYKVGFPVYLNRNLFVGDIVTLTFNVETPLPDNVYLGVGGYINGTFRIVSSVMSAKGNTVITGTFVVPNGFKTASRSGKPCIEIYFMYAGNALFDVPVNTRIVNATVYDGYVPAIVKAPDYSSWENEIAWEHIPKYTPTDEAELTSLLNSLYYVGATKIYVNALSITGTSPLCGAGWLVETFSHLDGFCEQRCTKLTHAESCTLTRKCYNYNWKAWFKYTLEEL